MAPVTNISKIKKWSKNIKLRDNFTCVICNSKIEITAHHLNCWQDFPKERFDLNNGITLCNNCHKKIHKMYGKNTTKEQFFDYLNHINSIKDPIAANLENIIIDTKLVGTKLNDWTILNKFRIKSHYYCTAICICGSIRQPRYDSLKDGTSKNCGCKRTAKLKLKTGELNNAYKHGASKRGKVTREYKIWAGIKTRCLNKNCRIYDLYGGRGIKICERWLNSFENFLSDVGCAPSSKHEIDRINVNGNYEPANCRWATRQEQSNNTRYNKYITIDNLTKTYAEWDKLLNLRPGTVGQRKRYGWTDKECIKPIGARKWHQ